MRTTLDIEDDILQAAKELAAKEGTTAGKILSQLARKGLHSPAQGKETRVRNGIPVFPARGDVITLEHVQKLMDEEAV
jgi:hypothetical protein